MDVLLIMVVHSSITIPYLHLACSSLSYSSLQLTLLPTSFFLKRSFILLDPTFLWWYLTVELLGPQGFSNFTDALHPRIRKGRWKSCTGGVYMCSPTLNPETMPSTHHIIPLTQADSSTSQRRITHGSIP